jgi:hypothetical protein
VKRALWSIGFLIVGSLSAGDNGLLGDWSLVLPSGEAGWLSIKAHGADLLWGVGNAKPVENWRLEGGTLSFDRKGRRPGADKSWPPELWHLTARVEGAALRVTLAGDLADSAPVNLTGKRLPPLPPKPDLSQVRFGEPIELLGAHDLAGWRPTHPEKTNGWSVREGVLRNETPKTDFSAYGDHANLRTEEDFDDFELHIEFRLPAGAGGNSGIYLRGLYEVQVTHRDSAMQGISGPGALFGRIVPTANAGLAAGEWETYDITLVDRHVTVIHNQTKVIDNMVVVGPTGGALHADVTIPGPIMLQGDHTSVEYRDIRLRPRVDP